MRGLAQHRLLGVVVAGERLPLCEEGDCDSCQHHSDGVAYVVSHRKLSLCFWLDTIAEIAIADTGTSLLGAPRAVTQRMQLGGRLPRAHKSYRCHNSRTCSGNMV